MQDNFSNEASGFPSPATDYVQGELDLNALLIHNPSTTFYLRVKGDAMANVGIYSDDILVVDRSFSPVHNDIIVVPREGELIVRRLLLENESIVLSADNINFEDIIINSREEDFVVFGVVGSVIKLLKI